MNTDRNKRDEEGSRPRTRVRARRGGKGRDSRTRDHSDSELTDISLGIQSRFPEHSDYDRTSHAYKESYVHPNGYPIGVTACKGLITIDPGEIDLDPPTDRPRDPGRGDDAPDGPVHPLGQHRQKEIPQRVPDNVVAWRWRLERSDGTVVQRVRNRANVGPEACQAKLIAPEPGRYRVHLTLELTDGEQTASRSFRIRDRLIVSIGDSYASGQGVPDEPARVKGTSDLCRLPQAFLRELSIPVDTEPVWVEPEAYRSFESGPAQAAKTVEDRTEGDLITFLSFASSGAEIKQGVLHSQGWQAIGQLEEIKQAVGNRTIDALLMSIGGNDVGFAEGLEDLARDFPVNKRTSAIEKRTTEEIRLLPGKYEDLAKAIDDKLDVRHIFITEYPIAHFDREDDGTIGEGCGVFDYGIVKITRKDAKAIKRMGRELNKAVKQAADDHDWTYVDGVVDGFRGHGYCRGDKRYFVTSSESCQTQGDFEGTMHPDKKGQQVYADRIAAALREEVVRPPTKVRDHRSRSDDGDESDRRSWTRHRDEERDDRESRGRQQTGARRRGKGASGRAKDRRGNVRDHRKRRR